MDSFLVLATLITSLLLFLVVILPLAYGLRFMVDSYHNFMQRRETARWQEIQAHSVTIEVD